MAFSEIQLKVIENTVGRMCERRSPAHLKDRKRLTYKVIGTSHSIEVYEERPGWKKTTRWRRMEIAKFRYVRATERWKLYWVRQDLKWQAYEPLPESATIEQLVAEVDRDPCGAFFG